jgi:hypothetical protein
VAACAASVMLRRGRAQWRGVPAMVWCPIASYAELARRREKWQAAHPLWPIAYLPVIVMIGYTATSGEARAGLPFWLLRSQDWLSGITAGLRIVFGLWVVRVLHRTQGERTLPTGGRRGRRTHASPKRHICVLAQAIAVN